MTLLRFQVPILAFPIFALSAFVYFAIALPLYLKPGTDEQRNDTGVLSDKDHQKK
jgi:hypothetical protein